MPGGPRTKRWLPAPESDRVTRTIALALLLLAVGLTGCVADTTSTSDSADDTPIDTAQAATSCPTGIDQYFVQRGGAGTLLNDDSWENRCPHAKGFVQMGGAGAVNVTVRDADGDVVLTTDLSPYTGGRQEFRTSSRGTPGTWQVEITGAYAGGIQVSLRSAVQP